MNKFLEKIRNLTIVDCVVLLLIAILIQLTAITLAVSINTMTEIQNTNRIVDAVRNAH